MHFCIRHKKLFCYKIGRNNLKIECNFYLLRIRIAVFRGTFENSCDSRNLLHIFWGALSYFLWAWGKIESLYAKILFTKQENAKKNFNFVFHSLIKKSALNHQTEKFFVGRQRKLLSWFSSICTHAQAKRKLQKLTSSRIEEIVWTL